MPAMNHDELLLLSIAEIYVFNQCVLPCKHVFIDGPHVSVYLCVCLCVCVCVSVCVALKRVANCHKRTCVE